MKRGLERARRFIAPAYLVACILLGGSAQGIWGNFLLQLAGIAILVFAAVDPSIAVFSRSLRFPALLMVAGLCVVLVQLVPMPPGLWTAIPGRSGIADGFHLLGWPLPWLPLSETPFDSLQTLATVVPPIAMVAAVLVSGGERRLAGALVAVTMLSLALGALQVAAGQDSGWYLYHFTNDAAVGFFANANHLADLLLSAIPFAAALLLSGRFGATGGGRGQARLAIALSVVGAILVGIVLSASVAVILLTVPVLLVSLLMTPQGWRFRWISGPLAALAITVGLAAVSLDALPSELPMFHSADRSLSSRQDIWKKTGHAIADTFPFGSGLGSFEPVYDRYEEPHTVTDHFVNHAHNDYLELVLELGIAGVILIILFFGWWGRQVVRVWTSKASSPAAKAATIASAGILAHSFVDFPLRTAALAAVFAMCIGIVLRDGASIPPSRRSPGARHVKIG